MTLIECPSREALQRYSAGDMPAAEGQTIDAHLGKCTACLGRLDELAAKPDQFIAALRQVPASTPEPNPALAKAVVAVLGGRDPSAIPKSAGLVAGTILNGYRILEELGRGGLGRVYRAAHPRLDQEVALKILRPGSESVSSQARFQAELHALTLMDHPHVARVLDGGTTQDGQPFFVMELVRGTTLTRYLDEHCLTIRQRLELFILICHAVQHAHQKGIIHRDLKPSNVLVADHGGKPAPKVIDFGVAKTVGRSAAQTEVGTIVGTLEYMSPEQANLDSTDIDTRSDVYSLGVLLYEQLTGETPLGRRARQKPILEVLRLLREEEPIAPSTLLGRADIREVVAARHDTKPVRVVKQIRGELDWIVLKALDKNRSRRYETAIALADDVQRYLNDEPVSAGPPSRAYRLKKFVRRHRGAVLAACLLLLALVGGTVGTALGLVRANHERTNSEAERDQKNTALLNLEEEQSKTQAALLAETQARKRAMSALRNLSDLIVVRQLGRQASLTPYGKAFLEMVLAEYEAFAATRGDSEESRAIRAEGNFRVGIMQSHLGASDRAIAAYERASDLYQKLAKDFQAVPDYRRNWARTRNRLGNQFCETGKWAEGEAEYRAALGLWEALDQQFPHDPENLRERAAVHANLGNVHSTRGNRAVAEKEYRKSLEITARLVKEHSRVPDDRHAEAVCRNNLAVLLKEMDRRADAATERRLAFDLLERLSAEYPHAPAYRQDLSRTQLGLGALLELMNERGEAEAEYRAALRPAKKLAADYPSMPTYRFDLASCHNALGGLLRKQDRREEAAAEHRQSLALAQQLVADFPTVQDYALRYGGSCCNYGNLQSEDGNHAESLEWYQKAIDTLKPMVEKQPRLVTGQRFLRNSYWGRAKALVRQGRFAEAMKDWDQAVTVAKGSVTRSLQFGRAMCRARIEPEQAVAEADKLLAGLNVRTFYFYRAAVVYSLASVQVDSDELKEKYAKRGVVLLRQARKYLQVPANLAKMKADKDLDPLRHRNDFKKLVAELQSGTSAVN